MFGWRAKIGLIVPSNNTVIEPELYPILPDGVSLHAARILTHGSDADSIIEMVGNAERAARELAAGEMDVIVYCCLSTTLVKGLDWNKEFTSRIGALARCPVVTAFDATLAGLRHLGLSQIGLVSPYPKAIHSLLPQALKAWGVEAVTEVNTPIEDVHEVPTVNERQVYTMARKAGCGAVEGVCVVATDLPTLTVIQALEDDVKKPVVTTNRHSPHCAQACWCGSD